MPPPPPSPPCSLPLALLLACGATGPTAGAEADRRPAHFDLCRQPGAEGAAWCGEVAVPRDPSRPGGATVSLVATILPALEEAAGPPVYLLAGGPGQGARAGFTPVLPALAPLRERHDLVLVDMRGTGDSSPMSCPRPEDPADLLRVMPDADELEACLGQLPLAPDEVSTAHLVADLEAVRRALGHETIALVGGSYGTRLALAYMRAHPDEVAAAVLDGVAPPQMVLFQDFAPDAQAALDAHLDACAAQASCRQAFPDLRGDLGRLLQGTEPDSLALTLPHPRTGEALALRLSHDAVTTNLRGLLYGRELAALLPMTLHRAGRGDPAALVAQFLVAAEASADSVSAGMMLSVVCTEDVPRLDREAAARAATDTFLGTAVVDAITEACAHWPHGPPPPGAADPVTSDVPTLLLSGARDPVTPPRWAELAAQTLPRSRHLVVPDAAHGTMHLGCLPERVAEFLDDPARLGELDDACVRARTWPAPFVGFWGPPP